MRRVRWVARRIGSAVWQAFEDHHLLPLAIVVAVLFIINFPT